MHTSAWAREGESLAKRTLITTAAMLTAASVFVGAVSAVTVLATSRAVGDPPASSAAPAQDVPALPGTPGKTPRVTAPAAPQKTISI